VVLLGQPVTVAALVQACFLGLVLLVQATLAAAAAAAGKVATVAQAVLVL
jgi:hypothetical protein